MGIKSVWRSVQCSSKSVQCETLAHSFGLNTTEYWLIDPLRERSEFYRLDAEGRYEVIFAGREGVYRSEVLPGFWLRVEWLWQEPLPHPLRVLGEIAGVDTELVERFLRALGGE